MNGQPNHSEPPVGHNGGIYYAPEDLYTESRGDNQLSFHNGIPSYDER